MIIIIQTTNASNKAIKTDRIWPPVDSILVRLPRTLLNQNTEQRPLIASVHGGFAAENAVLTGAAFIKKCCPLYK